ncbi:MAG: hypothetical protein H7839_20865 [Magnetococcus sp. YQC-5]
MKGSIETQSFGFERIFSHDRTVDNESQQIFVRPCSLRGWESAAADVFLLFKANRHKQKPPAVEYEVVDPQNKAHDVPDVCLLEFMDSIQKKQSVLQVSKI